MDNVIPFNTFQRKAALKRALNAWNALGNPSRDVKDKSIATEFREAFREAEKLHSPEDFHQWCCNTLPGYQDAIDVMNGKAPNPSGNWFQDW